MAPGGRARAEDGVGTPATLPTPARPRTPLGCPRAHPIRTPPCSASPWPPPHPGAWPRPPPGCRRANSALPSAAPSSRPSMMLARARAPPTWSRPASTFGLGREGDIGGGGWPWAGRGRAWRGPCRPGAPRPTCARTPGQDRGRRGRRGRGTRRFGGDECGFGGLGVGRGPPGAPKPAARARRPPAREPAARPHPTHSSRPCPPPPHSPPPLPPAVDGGRLGAHDCGRGRLGGRGAHDLGSRRARRAPVRRPGTGGDQRRRRNLVRAVSPVGGRPNGGSGRPPRVPACGARRL